MQYEKEIINGRKTYRLAKRVEAKEASYKAKKTRKSNAAKACSRKKRAAFYASREWLSLRFEILSRYGHKCMSCGVDRTKSEIHVDHIKPISRNWELRFRSSNLQVLCKQCNIGKRNWSEKDLRGE